MALNLTNGTLDIVDSLTLIVLYWAFFPLHIDVKKTFFCIARVTYDVWFVQTASRI